MSSGDPQEAPGGTDRADGAARPAPRNPSGGAVPAREILAAAARAGRRDGWRILAIAITVSTVTATGEIAVDHLIDPNDLSLSLLVGLSAGAVSILGTVLLSGFLTRLAGTAKQEAAEQEAAEQEAAKRRAARPETAGSGTRAPGRARRVTLGQVARQLPWGRLILADVLVVLLVIIGILALVLPGLVAFTLLAVTGPVIEIEDDQVLAALRRSARLVRHHFWSVVLLATVPVIVASEVESAAPEPSGIGGILEALAIRGIAGGVLEAAIGLILVELCYRLIALDARPPASAR